MVYPFIRTMFCWNIQALGTGSPSLHSLPVWLRERYWPSRNLCFPVCKTAIKIYVPCWAVLTHRNEALKALISTVWLRAAPVHSTGLIILPSGGHSILIHSGSPVVSWALSHSWSSDDIAKFLGQNGQVPNQAKYRGAGGDVGIVELEIMKTLEKWCFLFFFFLLSYMCHCLVVGGWLSSPRSPSKTPV